MKAMVRYGTETVLLFVIIINHLQSCYSQALGIDINNTKFYSLTASAKSVKIISHQSYVHLCCHGLSIEYVQSH